MAIQWGNHSLGPRQVAGWFFSRPVASGFLPVLSVMPLSPSFTDSQWSIQIDLQSTSFPIYNELGVSTIWVQLSDDGSTLTYFMTVMNFSNNPIEYAFLEADL
jgi:hypothetical protein